MNVIIYKDFELVHLLCLLRDTGALLASLHFGLIDNLLRLNCQLNHYIILFVNKVTENILSIKPLYNIILFVNRATENILSCSNQYILLVETDWVF